MEFDYHKAVQEGNVFEKNVFVEYGAVIGKNNIFSNNCVIRSCCVIGDNNFFFNKCNNWISFERKISGAE